MTCELCEQEGGIPVFRNEVLRVIRAQDTDHPAFYRVIWNAHVAESSDLDLAARRLCLDAVTAVEQALRTHLKPAKINLASLGNMVPHLHWHVIARFTDDAHWPQPVWAAVQRQVDDAALRLALPLDELDAEVVEALNALAGAA